MIQLSRSRFSNKLLYNQSENDRIAIIRLLNNFHGMIVCFK